MAGGDFRAATTVPSATLCPIIRAGPCSPQRLLNWMLALACQQGHLAVVKLLVLTYGADPESYAVRKNEFPVIVRLPLYAAIKSGGSQSGLLREPLSCRDAGPPVTLAFGSPVACVEFRSSVLGFFFKRSASSFLPPTPSCEGISVPGTNHGRCDSPRRCCRGQGPTQVLSLTGTCGGKGGNRDVQQFHALLIFVSRACLAFWTTVTRSVSRMP